MPTEDLLVTTPTTPALLGSQRGTCRGRTALARETTPGSWQVKIHDPTNRLAGHDGWLLLGWADARRRPRRHPDWHDRGPRPRTPRCLSRQVSYTMTSAASSCGHGRHRPGPVARRPRREPEVRGCKLGQRDSAACGLPLPGPGPGAGDERPHPAGRLAGLPRGQDPMRHPMASSRPRVFGSAPLSISGFDRYDRTAGQMALASGRSRSPGHGHRPGPRPSARPVGSRSPCSSAPSGSVRRSWAEAGIRRAGRGRADPGSAQRLG